MKLKSTVIATAFGLVVATLALGVSPVANAANYKLDIKGAHSFIQFKIKHLGYSWLVGRFNKFDGQFNYDKANEAASNISIKIDTSSIDSNHAMRDKHLRGDDFFDVKKFPEATFISKSFDAISQDKSILKGELTLHGVTKAIVIDVAKIGEGTDPWGGYRVGFEGTTKLKLKDYDMNYNLGPASEVVELYFSFEGIRQN